MKSLYTIILSGGTDPVYEELYRVNKSTWGVGPNIMYYVGFGTKKPDNIHDNYFHDRSQTLYIICKDDAFTVKTLYAMEFSLTKNWDYLWRVCSGSYNLLDKAQEWLQVCPTNSFYSGFVGQYNDIPFASGSGIFMSRDLVEKVVKAKDEILAYPEALYDDVAIGKYMKSINIGIVPLKRSDEKPIEGCFHYHPRTNIPLHLDLHRYFNPVPIKTLQPECSMTVDGWVS